MLGKEQKHEIVEELHGKFSRASSVFVAHYRGLSVQEVNELRTAIRQGEQEYEYKVAKNTLLRRAIADTDATEILPYFEGPTAVAFAFENSAGLAKVLVDYAKEHSALELRGGWVDGKSVSKDEIVELASLPSLDELRGKMVGLIQASAQKLASVIKAPSGQVARLIEARRGSLEESQG